MKNKIATTLALAALPLVFALSDDARADCQSACVADFPDACYNIKDYHWSKSDDGIAHVRVRNMGSFGGDGLWTPPLGDAATDGNNGRGYCDAP